MALPSNARRRAVGQVNGAAVIQTVEVTDLHCCGTRIHNRSAVHGIRTDSRYHVGAVRRGEVNETPVVELGVQDVI